MTRRRSTFDSVVWGVHHDAFTDPLGKILIDLWQRNVQDDLVVELIEKKVAPLQAQDALGELPPFRKPQLHEGEIILGFDRDGDPVFVPLQTFASGTLLAGNTGSGKSNFLFRLASQIAAAGCRIWVAEMYKQQIRSLWHVFQALRQVLIILRPSDWKSNILQCGPIDSRVYLAMVVDLLVRILNLPGRSASILYQAVFVLYDKFGIWRRDSVDEWPCLFDVYEWIYDQPGLNPAARDALLDRLGSLLAALTPQCAAWRRAYHAEDLSQFSIIFEMTGAQETVKQILLEPLLFSLLHLEIQQGGFNKDLSLVAFFEDAQRFFHTGNHSGEFLPRDELAGVWRGMGKGLFLNVQSLRGMSDIAPNLATKIMGRLGGHDDYRRLGADMGMTAEQIEYAKHNLRPGRFILQCADGDWRRPCLIEVPLVRLPSSVTKDQLAQSIAPLDAIATIPAKEYEHWQPRHMITTSIPSSGLSGIELRFLRAIVDDPGKPSSTYTRKVRIGGKKAAEIRKKLVADGYLREHKVATQARGRTAIVLEPLDPTFAAISQVEGRA